MRSVNNHEQFTPFGLWIREYCKSSSELSVTNLDYVFEDYKRKRIMLVEEKQSGGRLHKAQTLTFRVLDMALRKAAPEIGYQYCGFYVLELPPGKTMIGPGMKLNGKTITSEELQKHLNFEKRFCDPLDFDKEDYRP